LDILLSNSILDSTAPCLFAAQRFLTSNWTKENGDLDATVDVPQGKAFGSNFIRRWIPPEPVSRRGKFIYALFIDAIMGVQLNQRKRMEAVVAWFEVKPDTWVED